NCPVSRVNQGHRRERDSALRRAAIALPGRILSNVCPVALLVNVGVANSLSLFPFTRVIGLNVLFSLSVRLRFFRLLSVFMARPRTADVLCIGMFLRCHLSLLQRINYGCNRRCMCEPFVPRGCARSRWTCVFCRSDATILFW